MPEILHTCPTCKTPGFTERGLKSHKCTGVNRSTGKRISAVPVGASDTPAQATAHRDLGGDHAALSVATGTLEVVDERTEKSVSADFAPARSYLQGMRAMAHGVAAMTVLLGFELERLYKTYGVQRGGDRRSNPKGGSVLKWSELVKRELGISDESARNYRLLAEGAKKRIPAIREISDRIFDKSFKSLTDEECGELLEKTKGLLPSQSAGQLMCEWGITSTPKKKGGAREVEPRELTPEEQEAAQDKAAQDVFQQLYVDLITAHDTHRGLLLRLQPTVADPEKEISLVPLRDAIRQLLGLVEDTLATKAKLSRKGSK